MTDTASGLTPLEVRIVWIPEALPGSIFSAMDVIRVAASIVHLRNPAEKNLISWKIISVDGNELNFDLISPYPFSRQDPPPPNRTLIVIPAIVALNILEIWTISERYPQLLPLLQNHVQQGGPVAATFSGVIFLARAGLLNGKKVGLHWTQKSFFAKKFPECDFTSDEAISFNDTIFTSVAPSAQFQFFLEILKYLMGEELSNACAQIMEFQAHRQTISNKMVEEDLMPRTSDSPVFRATQWLKENSEKPYRLANLTDVAAVSERTLLRHFKAVMKMTPLEYLHKLRIERSKVMLEITLDNLHTIAQACGYMNASSFHRLFYKEMNMTPSEYRKHYALRSKRKHWRVEVNA